MILHEQTSIQTNSAWLMVFMCLSGINIIIAFSHNWTECELRCLRLDFFVLSTTGYSRKIIISEPNIGTFCNQKSVSSFFWKKLKKLTYGLRDMSKYDIKAMHIHVYMHSTWFRITPYVICDARHFLVDSYKSPLDFKSYEDDKLVMA